MPMTLSGDGTITGLAAGGLPDSSIVTVDIANAAITAAKLDGAQNGSAPIYGARAWVNFNGTGTVAIRASGNVSSITDNGTGSYRMNLTTAMSDANYSVVAAGSASDIIGAVAQCVTPRSLATTSVELRAEYNNGSYLDFANMFIAIFR